MKDIKNCKFTSSILKNEIWLCILGVLIGVGYFYYFQDDEALNISEIFSKLCFSSNSQMNNVILHNVSFALIIVLWALLTKNTLLLNFLIIFKSFLYTITLFNIVWKMDIVGLKIALILFLPFYVLYLVIYTILLKCSKEYIKNCNKEKLKETGKYIIVIAVTLLVLVILSIIEFECISHFVSIFVK